MAVIADDFQKPKLFWLVWYVNIGRHDDVAPCFSTRKRVQGKSFSNLSHIGDSILELKKDVGDNPLTWRGIAHRNVLN